MTTDNQIIHPANVLRDAVEVLKETGWTQGRMCDPDTGGHCLAGAICEAAFSFETEEQTNRAKQAGMWALAETIRGGTVKLGYLDEDVADSFNWADGYERDLETVTWYNDNRVQDGATAIEWLQEAHYQAKMEPLAIW